MDNKFFDEVPQYNYCCDDSLFIGIQKNKPQLFSLGAATLILMSGGMHLSLSFAILDPFLCVYWFKGSIVGALIGIICCKIVEKKKFILTSSLFIIIDGILLASFSEDNYGVILARFMNGIASGLTFVPLLILASEETVCNKRGLLVTTVETMSTSLGIFLFLFIYFVWKKLPHPPIHLNQILGMLSIVQGVIALIVQWFFYVESPVFYLVREEENAAMDSLRRLQYPFVINSKTHQQLKEHKQYIAHNKELTFVSSLVSSLPALLILCLYRSLVALNYSKPFYYALFFSSAVLYGTEVWTFVIMGTLRCMGIFLNMYMIDTFGRRQPMLFGTIVCGSLSVIIGMMFDKFPKMIFRYRMSIIVYLMLMLQFFTGIFIGSSSVYLSEAFPLAIKPFFIGITFIVEMLVQINYIVTFDFFNSHCYFYSSAITCFVFFFIGLLLLPETKRNTLREAQIKFSLLY